MQEDKKHKAGLAFKVLFLLTAGVLAGLIIGGVLSLASHVAGMEAAMDRVERSVDGLTDGGGT